MVLGSHANTRAMYSTPPWPSLAASMAAYRRRSFSDNHPKKRCIFSSISAEYTSMLDSVSQNLCCRKDTTAQACREVILDHILSHQAPIVGKHPEFVHGGQPVLCCKIQDPAAMREGQDFCDHEECVRALPGHGGERRLEVIGTMHLEGLQGHAQHPGRGLDLSEPQDHAGISGVPEYGHAGKRRDGLFEQLQAFCA